MENTVSGELFKKACKYIPGGVNSPVRACRSVGCDPVFITRAEGASVFDADGNEIEAGSGRQFVSDKHRLFFFGLAWDDARPDDIVDMSPIEFIYPDEPGFFSDTPKFECNEIDARFQP